MTLLCAIHSEDFMGRVGGMLRNFFFNQTKGALQQHGPDQGVPSFCAHTFANTSSLYSSFFFYYQLWFCINTMSLNMQGGLDRIWPNRLGTRILFETDQEKIYYYNPLNDQVPIFGPCCI